MIKAIALLARRTDLTRAEFVEYYENNHSKLIRSLLPVAISAVSLAELHFELLVATAADQRAQRLQRLIAATAHAKNPRLLTRNADDLRGIEHLVAVDTI